MISQLLCDNNDDVTENNFFVLCSSVSQITSNN